MSAAPLAATTAEQDNRRCPDHENASHRQPLLSKKEKGRFKKLWKRAHPSDDEQHRRQVGGISSRQDWNELRELMERKRDETIQLPATHVNIKPPNNDKEIIAEASDHRDILFWFLLNQGDDQDGDSSNNNKRKHADEQEESARKRRRVRLPHWVCLQNPVRIQRAAVLELNLSTTQQLEKLQSTIERLGRQRNCSCTSVKTNWFSNLHHPKSMTSSLMYAAPERPKPQASQQGSGGASTMNELYAVLCRLALTESQMRAEGYPTIDVPSGPANPPSSETPSPDFKGDSSSDSVLSPKDIGKASAISTCQKSVVQIVGENHAGASDALPPFVSTREQAPSDMHRPCEPRIFALDCEMVQTKAGMELARVTLIQLRKLRAVEDDPVRPDDMDHVVAWDQLVRPQHTVVDYLTQYSGVSADMLDDPDNDVVTLEQVQAAFLNLLTPRDIIIGHSLENDMTSLRMVHPLVVDTALLFRPSNGSRFKFSLRHLAGTLLRSQIQRAGVPHCSEEDALAALRLAVHRAVRGRSFGIWDSKREPASNQLVEMSLEGGDHTVVCLGPSAWLGEHVTNQPTSFHALECGDIRHPNRKAVASWLTGRTRRATVVWASWTICDDGDEHGELESVVGDLMAKLPVTDAMVLISLQVSFAQTIKLTQRRRACMNPKSTLGWTDGEQHRWLKAVHQCRTGTAIYVVPS